MPLTSRTNVKAYCGVTVSTDDSLIDSLILYADAAVKKATNRVFASASYTERRDGNGREELRLQQYPVTALTSVKVDSNREFGADTALDADEYDLDGDAGLVYRIGTVWPCGTRNIQVVYTAGYSTIPDDVVHAANIIVADWYTRAKQLAGGQSQNELSGENLGEESQSYVKELVDGWGIPAQAVAILDRYRQL